MIHNNYELEKLKKLLEFGKKHKIQFRLRISIFIRKNNKLLIAYNPFSEESKYLIPGGEIEKSIRYTAKKEAEEEIGVRIKNIRILPKLFFYLFPDIEINSKKYIGTISLFCLCDYKEDIENSNPEFEYLEEDPDDAIKKIEQTLYKIKDPKKLWILSLIQKEIETINYIKNNHFIKKELDKIKEEKQEKNKYNSKDIKFFHFNVRLVIKTEKDKDKEEIPEKYNKKINWLKEKYDIILSYLFKYFTENNLLDTFLKEEDFKTFIEPKIISFYSSDEKKILILFKLPIKKLLNRFITVFIKDNDIDKIGIIDENDIIKRNT